MDRRIQIERCAENAVPHPMLCNKCCDTPDACIHCDHRPSTGGTRMSKGSLPRKRCWREPSPAAAALLLARLASAIGRIHHRRSREKRDFSYQMLPLGCSLWGISQTCASLSPGRSYGCRCGPGPGCPHYLPPAPQPAQHTVSSLCQWSVEPDSMPPSRSHSTALPRLRHLSVSLRRQTQL